MRRFLRPLLAALLLSAPLARAQDPVDATTRRGGPAPIPLTFGGSLGFGFGSVTWVSVSGEVGYLPADKVWVGVSGMFRYTDDSRYRPHFSGVDYGFGVFGRYFVYSRFFASAEWAWTSYENRTPDLPRDNITSFFVGGGYGQPVGARSNVMLEVLYDVTGHANGIYGTPWVVRAGFTYGF